MGIEALRQVLAGYESCLVCYSGGVDSALVADVAQEALGERMAAVIGKSASLASTELHEARELARDRGFTLLEIDTREMEREAYRANTGDRCYHCKRELYELARALADSRSLAVIADGTHIEDQGGHRPGLRAGGELGVRSPLVEAGLGKAGIRELARARGLSVADKPAQPCLSSRLPVGERVTSAKLSQVEAAEAAIRAEGFKVVRVRHHGELARVELGVAELPRLKDESLRLRIARAVRATGYSSVAIAPEGYLPS